MKPIEIDLSKKMTLLLATFAPALFGCLYYIFVHIPVMGDIWYLIAPFGILLYWAYVGTMYRDSEMFFIPSVVVAHLYAVVFFIIYMVVYYGTEIVQGDSFVDQIVFWFTYPLQFLTVSAATLIHGSEITDAQLVFYTQLYGLIGMMLAFTIGFAKRHFTIDNAQKIAARRERESRNIQESTRFKARDN